MATTAATLRSAVCAFMNRSTTAFTVNSVDLALQAINNTRLYAERLIDFELSSVTATVAVTNPTAGGSLDNAKLYGTSTAVSIKKVITPFVVMATDVHQTPLPIPLWSRRAWERYMGNKMSMSVYNQSALINLVIPQQLVVVQDGKNLFATPITEQVLGSTYNIHFSGFKWLPAYTSGLTETDFLLDYCFDWMMYKSIQELNFFLKEDERVVLSEAVLEKHWDAVVKWNNTLMAQNNSDAELD